MRTALYARVSTEEQAKEGYSIAAQKRRLKSFCIAQDWEIAGYYIDEGISAKDMERPNLKRMINDIEKGLIDCVLVYKLDRLTRSVFDLYKLLDVFEKNKCKFRSVTEIYDTTTATGRMFITLVASFAQFERENMGERISLGFAEKARQGKHPLNFRPFGYDLDLRTSKLSINRKEAKYVRLIYDLYLKGYGANKVCQHLNNRSIFTRDGNKWHSGTLMYILKSPLYIGHITWNGELIKNTHDPIIDENTFNEVQQLIIKRRTVEPRSVASEYIFSSKIRCPHCRKKLVGFKTFATLSDGTRKSYKNYRCKYKKTGACKGVKTLSEKKLEAAFLDYISGQEFNVVMDETIKDGKKFFDKKDKFEVDEEGLKKQLEKIERRKKNWQYAFGDGAIPYEDFKKRMDEATKEEEEIKNQLNVIEKEEEIVFKEEEIRELLVDLKRNWNILENIEKKNLIDSIIKEVYTGYDNGRLIINDIDFI